MVVVVEDVVVLLVDVFVLVDGEARDNVAELLVLLVSNRISPGTSLRDM